MDLVLALLLCVYIAPWCVACWRDHPHWAWILAFNLALGWTGLGWLAALYWAAHDPPSVKEKRRRKEQEREEQPQRASPALRVIPGGRADEAGARHDPPRRSRRMH